jgi:hypothetical protein
MKRLSVIEVPIFNSAGDASIRQEVEDLCIITLFTAFMIIKWMDFQRRYYHHFTPRCNRI